MKLARYLAALCCAWLLVVTPDAVAADRGLPTGQPTDLPAGHGEPTGLPSSIAALGDSITRGFNACGFYVDCTRRSWSTGDDRSVDSHRLRLRELGVVPTGEANLARTGARSYALPEQARRAVEVGAQYVTIEIGANDACAPTEAGMTPLADYRRNIAAALSILHEELPRTRVFVASIPDLWRLWAVGHGSWYARRAWDRFDICQSMLAHAGSSDAADVQRRGRVRTRTILYNDILAAACADYGPLCKFDDQAVFDTSFTRSQLSKWDFFHPSEKGQALLAEITWEHGFFWHPTSG